MKYCLILMLIFIGSGCKETGKVCKVNEGFYWKYDIGKDGTSTINFRGSILISRDKVVFWPGDKPEEHIFSEEAISCIDTNIIGYNNSNYKIFAGADSLIEFVLFDSVIVSSYNSQQNSNNIPFLKIRSISVNELILNYKDTLSFTFKGDDAGICKSLIGLINYSNNLSNYEDIFATSRTNFIRIKVFKGNSIEVFSSENSDIESIMIDRFLSWCNLKLDTHQVK